MHNSSRSRAVSEVVGEMLMIGVVLILAAVFTSQLPNYLPSERSPSVTIMMSNDTQNVTLWHKGGDWVKVSDLKVILSSPGGSACMNGSYVSPEFSFVPDSAENQSSTFDIGGNITIVSDSGLSLCSGTKVTLATDRAVLFTGVLGGGQP